MRRAREEHHIALLLPIIGYEPLSWRGAVGIAQHHSPVKHLRLALIVFRHLQTPFGKSLIKRGNDLRIVVDLDAERIGDTFAREVVFRWTKSTHEDHNVSTREPGPSNVDKVPARVANYGFEAYFDSKLVQPISEKKRVGILAVGCKQLRANRDDLRNHLRSIAFVQRIAS